MSINDGPSPEMRHFAHPEVGQPLSAADAERLLAGHGAAPGAPEEEQTVAMLLRHAAGPAQKQELAGEVSAIAAFTLVKEQKTRRVEGPVRAADRRRRAGAAGGRWWWTQARRRPIVVACASAAVVLALSATGAADDLPTPMQRLAHDTFGAPAPRHPVPSVTTTPGARRGKRPPVSPDATPEKPTTSESPHGNGKAAGKAVGNPAGKAVGNPAGKAVGNPAAKAVGKAVGNPAGKAVGKAVGKAEPAKPAPGGVAKGHAVAHGHH